MQYKWIFDLSPYSFQEFLYVYLAYTQGKKMKNMKCRMLKRCGNNLEEDFNYKENDIC